MVSPEMDVLSVFITPWMKPRSIHCATRCAWRAITPSSSARQGCFASDGLGIVASDGIVRERSGRAVSPRAAKYWKVPTRRWLAATRVSTAPGKTVSRTTFAGGHGGEGARRRHAQRRHGLADDVLAKDRAERGSAVAAAGEGGSAGTLELDVVAYAVAP